MTLRHMLVAIEVKASERCAGRLRPGEIMRDIDKIAAHRDEVSRIRERGRGFAPVVMIIDAAYDECEQMTQWAFDRVREHAAARKVAFYYLCQDEVVVDLPAAI